MALLKLQPKDAEQEVVPGPATHLLGCPDSPIPSPDLTLQPRWGNTVRNPVTFRNPF